MKFSYKKLWKLLIDKGMLKKDLVSKAGLSPTTISSMVKEKAVSLETLGRICLLLECNIGDIVDLLVENK